jgi:orotidine-5'-phosphate decarboxylase
LIVALDVPNVDAAKALVCILGEAVGFYKIGLELAMSGGLDLARSLTGAGKQVFLDMKLLDIENTVERATRSAAATGATFLTVHGHDTKTLRAAVAGKAGSQLKILAVTVLTNLDASDLREQGISLPFADVVLNRAKLARETGCEGVVASGHEVRQIRSAVGADLLIVTPAIRMPSDAAADQTRAATPGDAIVAGADYLVVGRPITQAADPRRAADVFAGLIDAADNATGSAQPA